MPSTRLLALQLLVAAATLLLWHLAGTTTLFGDPRTVTFFFSTPLDVAQRIVEWFVSGSIWYHLGITLLESALAFVIGAVGGVVVGFASFVLRLWRMRKLVEPAPDQTDPGNSE